jgi:putative Mn2+ efflux pump MntP
MQLIEILIIAIALSFDSFAVSFAASTSQLIKDKRGAFRLAFHLGLFQFLMPILGWALGLTIEPILAAYDHWIAFLLLVVVGIRMIGSANNPDSESEGNDPSRGVTLVVLAIATSIDAMAVGLGMAMLGIAIWYPSIVIGLVTASMSVLAIVGGSRVGGWMGKRAQIAGGIVLILIGVRIVISHMAGLPQLTHHLILP